MEQSSSDVVDTVYKSRKVESKKTLLLRIQPCGREFLFVCPEEAVAKGAEDFNTLVDQLIERLEDGNGYENVWWELDADEGMYETLVKKLTHEKDLSKRKELLQELITLAESKIIEHAEAEAGLLLDMIEKQEDDAGADNWKPNDIEEHCMNSDCPLEYILVDCAAETHVNIVNKCVACWMNTFGVQRVKTFLETVKRTGYWGEHDCYKCYRRAAKKGDIETMKKMDAMHYDQLDDHALARSVCDVAVDTPLPDVIAYLCEIDGPDNSLSSSMVRRCLDNGYITLLEKLEKQTSGKLNLDTPSFLNAALYRRNLSVVQWLVQRGATFLNWDGAVECTNDFIKEVRGLLINCGGYDCTPSKERKAFLDFVKTIKGYPEKLKDLC
jgi:hypothetical protein